MIDDPNALAAFISNLGGKPIEHESFRFELPLSQVREIVPKICNTLDGVGVRKVDEYRDQHPTRQEMHSVAVLELYRRPAKQSDHLEESGIL